MASADITTVSSAKGERMIDRLRALLSSDNSPKPIDDTSEGEERSDVLTSDGQRKRERHIPVARSAVMERLSSEQVWKPGQAAHARRFFRYLDYWRQQQYNADLLELEQCYEPFCPDSEHLQIRGFTQSERALLQSRFLKGVEDLLKHANYERIDPRDVTLIVTRESHFGLDFTVDINAFEEIMIYYRGASNKRYERRLLSKFMRRDEFDVSVFRRLLMLFKLKPFDVRVEEIMKEQKLDREHAIKHLTKLRANLPPGINEGSIYLKLFKNIPRSDLEMVFPNTQVRFRTKDKFRLGVTAGGGLGAGAVGAAGKIALIATNPIAAATAAVGVGSIAFRQAMGFVNQKQRYLVVMAQKLYSHTMADNRGVILQIAAGAVEEDIKEEMLLYSVLAKEKATRAELPAVDYAIEQFLTRTFGVKVDFDIYDALERLIRDGIVKEAADGTLVTLPPAEAARHIDAKWDGFLDQLSDASRGAGADVV